MEEGRLLEAPRPEGEEVGEEPKKSPRFKKPTFLRTLTINYAVPWMETSTLASAHEILRNDDDEKEGTVLYTPRIKSKMYLAPFGCFPNSPVRCPLPEVALTGAGGADVLISRKA